ncbi:MAG: PHP domain-containing protein [Saprospiraceae bacterium]|nr:PHP domain-containing protein [Saprospiraceae bacterium]
MRQLFALFLCLMATALFAQAPHPHVHDRSIHFPDVNGYRSLVCDFHQHTVFSDGSVFPDIRVQEALRDSLDAISLTEHLEYQPHKEDIPHPDRNRSNAIAEQAAKPYNLIVINGSEITREMPPGHNNALFLSDANKLLKDDPLEAFKEAQRQGAFVFWNHPNWVAQTKDGIAKLTDMHRQLIANKQLHGIEVVNETTYSDEALQIALDNGLTLMGTSDIHGLIDWTYKIPEGGHRPVTLVFAKERTADAIKEALFERRTAVWHNNTLIAREREMMPLLAACIKVEKASYIGPSSVCEVLLRNESDAEFLLFSTSEYTLHEHADMVVLNPNGTTKIQVKTKEQLPVFNLSFDVLNCVTAPKKHPQLQLSVRL